MSGIVPHPSEFIAEEMAARGWSRDRLAIEMGGDAAINRLTLDLYFDLGPDKTNMRLGRSADDLARAFGVSPDFFRNLEKAWLKDRGSE